MSHKTSLTKISFNNQHHQNFLGVLKTRVDRHFQSAGVSRHANGLMIAKTVFYFGGWILLYALLLSFNLTTSGRMLVMVALGFFGAGIGFNIGHDAIHGAYSSKPRVNRLISLAFEFIGASAYTWKVRHNVLHHNNTNVMGSDGDLESMPLLRFCLKPNRKWFHAYQHLYAPFLYSFTSLVWVFKKDFVHMLEERRDQRLKRPPPLTAYVSLVGFKLLHFFLFLILPALVLDVSYGHILMGFLAMHFVMGLMLATVFQLGHCVEGPEILSQPLDGYVNDSWAAHQLKTSANFSGNSLSMWICGGLNFQIEHHLFTNMCHVHYPALSKIVRHTAKEFGLPYHEYPGFFAAVRSHYRTLKFFGNHD